MISQNSSLKKSLALTFGCLFFILLSMSCGKEGFISLLTEDALEKIIVFDLRLPRVMLGLISGAILGVTGLVFQSLFRNDLASPYTLGVSAGAAFGASLGITLKAMIGFSFSLSFLSIGFTGLMAFLGALVTVIVIFSLARLKRSFHPNTLILSGVVTSFFFSSCIVFMHFLNDSYDTKKIIQWTLGDLTVVGFTPFYVLAPVIIGLIIYLVKNSLALNTMAIGDVFAKSRGIDIDKLRIRLFIIMSLGVSIAISFVGPISFVGLIIPHLVKKLWGLDFRKNLYPTLLCSGTFLVVCDLLAQVIISEMILPVGVITAFLGGPFFLGLILLKKELV